MLPIALGFIVAAVYGFVIVPIFVDGKWINDREGRYGDRNEMVWVPWADLKPSDREKTATRTLSQIYREKLGDEPDLPREARRRGS